MDHSVGIHIQAKANLNELEQAADKLRQFGGMSESASRKINLLVESLHKGAETDVNRLAGQIDKLKEKISDPNLGKKERAKTQDEISGLKTKIAELKKLQRIKADDYGMMEQEARHALEKLRNKKKITDAEKEHLKVVEQLLKYTDKYNKAKVGLNELHLNKIEKQWGEKRTQAESAGMDVGKTIRKYSKRAAGLVIGGSLLGFGVNAMKKWAELDTIVTRLSASLDDLGRIEIETMNNMANDLGYTNKEALEFQKTIGAIAGDMNKIERDGYENLLNYGRDTGIGPLALQLRQIQQYSGESMKPGAEDKELLKEMSSVAKALTMRGGRMEEFVNVSIALVKNMERANMRVDEKDLLRNTLSPAVVFGGEDRGRGQRGLSFMERLNQGLVASNDMMNLSMLRTVGVPKSFKGLWEFKKLREKGVWAESPKTGNPMFMDVIDTFKNMYGGKHRAMAMMKAAMPNMSAIEVEQMFKMNEGLNAGTWNMRMGALKDKDRERLQKAGFEMGEFTNDAGEKVFGMLNMSVKDFKKLSEEFPKLVKDIQGQDKVSAGEKWKVAIEDMQKSIGGIFGKSALTLFTGIAKAVDALASKFGGESYKSQSSEIEKIGKKYITKDTKATSDYADESKEIFDLDLEPWKNAIREEKQKGFIGKRWRYSRQSANEKKNIIAQLDEKYPNLSDEEKIKQIRIAETRLQEEADDKNKSSLIDYYKSEIDRKKKLKTQVEANLRLGENKGWSHSKHWVEALQLEHDIEELGKLLSKLKTEELKKQVVSPIENKKKSKANIRQSHEQRDYNPEEVLKRNASAKQKIIQRESAGLPIDPAAIDTLDQGGSGGGGGGGIVANRPGNQEVKREVNNYYTLYIEREKFPDMLRKPGDVLKQASPYLKVDNDDF